MTEKLTFRPEAEADVADAFDWYESHRPGLGGHFLLCMEAAVSQILRHPEAFPVVHRKIRRALLRRFPYGVYYIVGAEEVVVIAVFHAKRSPRRLKDRR